MVNWLGAMLFWRHLLVSNQTVYSFASANFARYVAMHSMTEATNPQEEPIIHGYMDAPPGKPNMSKTDILIVVFGMLLPLVTQIGHAHAHAH